MKNALTAIVLLLVATICGCGGSSETPPSSSGSASQTAATGSVTLRFDGPALNRGVQDQDARLRLPPGITALSVQVFTENGAQLLQELDLGPVAQVQIDGLPQGQVFIRIRAFASGNVLLGYRDLLVSVGSIVDVDTLLAGEPGPAGTIVPRLAFRTHPQDTASGVAQTVEVVALDQTGLSDSTFAGTVSLSAQGQGELTPTNSTAPVNGVTQLSVIINGQGSFTLTASTTGLTSAVSLPFTLTGAPSPGPTPSPTPTPSPSPTGTPVATSLNFLNVPDSGVQLTPFTPPIQVEVLDQFGARFTSAQVTISLSFAGDPTPTAGAFLRGSTQQLTVDGLATFVGLEISTPGTYRLVASSAGLQDGLSTPINIGALPAPVTQNFFFLSSTQGNRVSRFDSPHLLDGGAAPAAVITGGMTALSQPDGVALDSNRNEIYVSRQSLGPVLVFDKLANGDVAPLRTLANAGGLPQSVAFDSARNLLYVSFSGIDELRIFENPATLGATPAPSRRVTGFTFPYGICLDPVADRIFVVDQGAATVRVIDNASSADGTLAAVGARTLDGLFQPRACSYDRARDRLYVGKDNGSVSIFNNASTANNPGTHDAIINGGNTGFSSDIDGVAIDSVRDQLYVSVGIGSDTVRIFHNASTLVGANNIAPDRVLNNAAVGGAGGSLYVP